MKKDLLEYGEMIIRTKRCISYIDRTISKRYKKLEVWYEGNICS